MNKISIEYEENITYPNKDNLIFPNKKYIELPFNYERIENINFIFEMIRESFKNLKLDENNIETEKWNPLGNLINEGDTVLIKPNMVLEKNAGGYGEECLYTNPSLVAAIIPYVCKSLNGKGKIIVADAPVQSCNFEELVENSGYKKIIDYYKKLNVNIELKDLRGLISKCENGVLKQDIYLENNRKGIIVDLGKNSEHANLDEKDLNKIRITNYNPNELLKHHNAQKHEYLISREVLEADVIINMPKPKSHRKAGVTIGLKNFVGINTRKEYLPHHRFGDVKHGGDEFSKNSLLLKISSKLLDKYNNLCYRKKYNLAKIILILSKVLSKLDKVLFSKEKNREGSWYGNDTIWRTIIDLNKIVRYADKSGNMKENVQRKIFTIADMIVVGEKEGPMLPSPKYAGIIAMGEDLVCFDEIIATILGMDINKIPLFKHLREKRKYPLVENDEYGIIVSNVEKYNNKKVNDISRNISINIEPTEGWKGHIELDN